MAYYTRVLSTSVDCVPLSRLRSVLRGRKLKARLEGDTRTSKDWAELMLVHEDGRKIAAIERNSVDAGSLGSEELQEFSAEIDSCLPTNAARWLQDYFRGVRCIYAFQLLTGTDHKNGWAILGAVKDSVWSFAPSILQADGEGFSNEDGCHILWQFDESVEGDWWMGLLDNGQWKHFQMDLGNPDHREAFLSGRIPDGAAMA